MPVAESTGSIISVKTDVEVLADLKRAIEDLSDGVAPMISRCVYTARRTQHVIFSNGAEKREGEVSVPNEGRSLQQLADATLIAVRAYRQRIYGEVDLVWRCEPQIDTDDTGKNLYTRLCFEPSISEVSPGIWVENRKL